MPDKTFSQCWLSTHKNKIISGNKMKKSCLFTFTSVLMLTGCANPMEKPFLADITTYPDRIKVSTDKKEDIIKVSYLSRHLMESDNRAAIERKVTNSKAYTRWSAAQTSTIAQMSTDLAVGQFDSSAGATVGAVAFGAGLILGEVFDGSNDYASTAWIPNHYNGTQIETSEQAMEALRTLSETQVKKIADTMKWQAECVYGCQADSTNVYYYLTNKDNHPLHGDYIYKPQDILIRISFTPLVKVADNDPVHVLIGDDIGWRTNGVNSFVVSVLGSPNLDDSGKPAPQKMDSGDMLILAQRDLRSTHIGRDMMRTFHSTPYTFQGDGNAYPHVIYYDNVAYSFSTNSNTYIANQYIPETSLLDGTAPVTTPPELQTPIATGSLR